jgi:hypothetical protein
MRPERLCVLAQRIAEGTPEFFSTKGPGKGDHATAAFVRSVREAARGMFGTDYSEKPACTSAGFRFDFFFPEEAVAVEFAFGLHNPNSEFERDIFKCLLAIDDGCPAKKLMLIGKPGDHPLECTSAEGDHFVRQEAIRFDGRGLRATTAPNRRTDAARVAFGWPIN